MAIYTSITDLIGGTPLLELKNYEAENTVSYTHLTLPTILLV